MNNFTQRTLSGVAFVAIIAGALIGGPLAFLPVFALISGLCLNEFVHLAKRNQAAPGRAMVIAAGTLIFLAHHLAAAGYWKGSDLHGLFLLPIVMWVWELVRQPKNSSRNLAYALMALIYPASFMASINYLAFPPEAGTYSPWIILGLFLLIWTFDTTAYLTGKWLGRHKIDRRLSPGKSWEGVLGGLIFGVFMSWILTLLLEPLPFVHWAGLAVIVALAGTTGDMSESALKRNAGLKDSGQILPGHGGMLDRMDAALFVFPLAFLYLKYFVW